MVLTDGMAETVHATDANALYPCPVEPVASKIRFAHRSMAVAALTVADGMTGLTGCRMFFEDVLAVGYSAQESELPVHRGRSSPPNRVKVSPALAYVTALDAVVILGKDTRTTLSLSHVHVANVTPTVRNSSEHGQEGVAMLALSVFESRATRMASPLSERRTVDMEGGGWERERAEYLHSNTGALVQTCIGSCEGEEHSTVGSYIRTPCKIELSRWRSICSDLDCLRIGKDGFRYGSTLIDSGSDHH